MKGFTKKIAAFTIAEMLVVLVISAIVISMAMLVLNLVQKQLGTMKGTYALQTEVQLLERGLWQDLNKHAVYYDSQQQQLICTSELDTVHYIFNENEVLRNRDTIKATVLKTTAYLDGNSVMNNRIDAIEIEFSKNWVQKRYL